MSTVEHSLKSLTSSNFNDLIQSHNSLTFKLLKTVADFSQALANLHDRFGHELQMLVETFRKRNGELRKERLNCPNSLFQIWELFLQQVEVNSQQHGDISRDFSQSIGNGLVERVFHRKIQSKKIFAHRDRIETILGKSNELLLKCYNDYCQNYALALTDPVRYMSEYIASHNVYVHQLQATNGMIHAYQTKTLPSLLEDLEECQLETSASISSSLLSSSELVSEKSNEQASGYLSIASACKQANHRQDLLQFVKAATTGGVASHTNESSSSAQNTEITAAGEPDPSDKSNVMLRYHQFQSPSLKNCDLPTNQAIEQKNLQVVPTFRNEIAPDLSKPPAQQQPQLEKDRESLEERIEKFEERLESLGKLLARSSESRLHNKVNELQEEICQKRFDLYVAQIHLSAVRSQLQLFEYNYRPVAKSDYPSPIGVHVDPPAANASVTALGSVSMAAGQSGHRRSPSGLLGNSSGSGSCNATPAYRSKWIKALKSLKESPSSSSGGSSQYQKGTMPEDVHRVDESLQPSQQVGKSSQVLMDKQVDNIHCFQEYTFKKIASCDVCKEFLRGHMRQGVKCKVCRITSHNECQSKANSVIKCQQPKIKLLRRQKSAGELEIGVGDNETNPESNEKISLSSKPDGIYQLIKQVLDAKKRGHTQHPTENQNDHLLRSGYPANTTSGNLTLADRNGKSVSTSALGTASATSVDRWSVVMDLLAQSRQKENTVDATNTTGQISQSSSKRHSKQLDKFKSAALSAAAASRNQRQFDQHHLAASSSTPISGHQYKHNQLMPYPHIHPTNIQVESGDSGNYLGQLNQETGVTNGSKHPQQSMHVQQTKSLPIPEQKLHLSTGFFPDTKTAHSEAKQDTSAYQLLPIGGNESQSTSAPHSPQRKRFNLRMKSFSLDSPESPSVTVASVVASGALSYGALDQSSVLSDCHQSELKQETNCHRPQQQDRGHHPTMSRMRQNENEVNDYQKRFGYQYHQDQVGGDSLNQSHYINSANQIFNSPSNGGQRQSSASNYQHRHSYHNPSINIQQQRLGHISGQMQQQHGGSHSNLNSAHMTKQLEVRLAGSILNNHRESMGCLKAIEMQNPDIKLVSLNADACSEFYDMEQSSSSAPIPMQSGNTSNVSSGNHFSPNVQSRQLPGNSQGTTYVVLYDYIAQRPDELQLVAGQIVVILEATERDWWKVCALNGLNRSSTGFFPSTYLAKLYDNERPLQVVQTIQVSNGDACEKLLRGQIVIHTGKHVDNFVTIRIASCELSIQDDCYIQCPEKYLREINDSR